MDIGINGTPALAQGSLADVRAEVEYARRAGLASFWLGQVGLGDALTVFSTGVAGPHLEVGTAVVPTYTRHPVALAAQALTVQALIPGRLTLGIGLSHQPAVEGAFKLNWTSPLRHMADYLDVLLPLLATGEVDHVGSIWGAELSLPRPTEAAPAVLLAALGPRLLELAGRRADGTILWLVGPRTIAAHIRPRIEQAATAAGRPSPRIVASLPVCVTDDAAAARQFIGTALGRYASLPSYRAMLDHEGVDGPADVAVVGSEAEVVEQLQVLAQAGATDFAALPLTPDPELAARTRAALAERVPA